MPVTASATRRGASCHADPHAIRAGAQTLGDRHIPRLDGSLDLRAMFRFGGPELPGFLQVHPDVRAGAEPPFEAQCGISRDAATFTGDFGNAIGWNGQRKPKLTGTHVELFERFGDVLAGVDWWARH